MAFSLQQTVIELFAQQLGITLLCWGLVVIISARNPKMMKRNNKTKVTALELSLIHISAPTRRYDI